MVKTKKVSRIKAKKKKWFPIFAPSFLGQREVGETFLQEPETALKRKLRVNLKELTGSMRDQNIHVSLRVSEVKNNTLQTEVIGYSYMSFYIKKLVRRNNGKIDDSLVLKTKDNRIIRIKPLIITVFPVKKSLKTVFRKRLAELLSVEVGKLTLDNLINDLLKYKLQVDFKKKLNKLYPVREVVIRVVKLEERKGVKLTKIKEKKLVEVKEEKLPEVKEGK